MNLVVLSGRLTKDPELKFGESGKAYSRFTIAVDRYGKDNGTDFINCVAFGKTAEFISEYFSKGRKILLNGTLQMNQYEKEGRKITTYVVIANNVEFADSKPSNENKEENLRDYAAAKNSNDFNDDEFPF